jgi:MFS family permease
MDDGARATRLLLATRFVRSIGQGALAVDFTLYLRALDWSAVAISAVLSAALITGVVLTLFAGPLSDRGGRRRFLLIYEAAQTVAGVAAALSARPLLLTLAALVGGFGRGGNGGAGPFAPVEQAWLAQAVAPMRRGPVYSLNAALGFLGNAVGAILAATPLHPANDHAWHAGLSAAVRSVCRRITPVLRVDIQDTGHGGKSG